MTTYQHLDIGHCTACGAYRNRWLASNSTLALCGLCITRAANAVLMPERDARKHQTQIDNHRADSNG